MTSGTFHLARMQCSISITSTLKENDVGEGWVVRFIHFQGLRERDGDINKS